MLIGEIVKRTNLTRDTIRFYEKKGLISVGRSSSRWNNYKNYDDKTLEKLFLIKKAKGFGFTLNEIAGILTLVEGNNASCEIMATKVNKKLTEIDQKINDLLEMRNMISNSFEKLKQRCIPTQNKNCQMFKG